MRHLFCEACRDMTPHTYLGMRFMSHAWKGLDELVHSGNGIKEIWVCVRCTSERIYGAPRDIPPENGKSRGRPRTVRA